MTPQEQAAFDAMLEALKHGIKWLNLRGEALECMPLHEALASAKAVSEQPQAQGDDSQICDEQRRALIAYGDARESKDPDAIATAFVNALHTLPQARKPLTKEEVDQLSVGMLNAIGGIYATSTMDFVRAIEAAHGIKE